MDEYSWWQNALAGNRGEIAVDEPQSGRYRIKRKNRDTGKVTLAPVAYWRDDGKLRCRVGNQEIDELKALELWPFASLNPITNEVYRAVCDGGHWPDLDPVVADQTNGDGTARGIGDNQPPTDPAEILKGEIDAATAGASDYALITTDETDAKALSLKNRLTELAGQAVKKHKVEKDPHLEAGRAVDRRWFPLRDVAQSAAAAITTARNAWANEKLRRTREAQHAAEVAQRKLEEDAIKAAPQGSPPVVPKVEVPVFAPVATKAAYGRSSGTKLAKIAVISDWGATWNHFSADAELRARLQKLAQRAVDDNLTVPGVTIREEARVT